MKTKPAMQYKARCMDYKKGVVHMGVFQTREEAEAWQDEKEASDPDIMRDYIELSPKAEDFRTWEFNFDAKAHLQAGLDWYNRS